MSHRIDNDPPRFPQAHRPGKGLRASLPPKSLAGFAAAILAVVGIALISQETLHNRTEGAERMAHTLEVSMTLESLLSTITEAETGQRGYLLAGDGRYLEPYDAAVVALPRELEQARRALARQPAQLERLEAAAQLAAQRMDRLARGIELSRSGHQQDALAMIRTHQGRELMKGLRKQLAEIRETERSRLGLHTRQWRDATWWSSVVVLGGATMLLCLIGTAALLSSRDFRQQRVEAWIRTGQTRLAQQMQGEHDVTRLADKIVAFLAHHLQAQVGAVYFADRDQLRLVGGYGLSKAAAARTPVGLTRQAFEHESVLHVTNVPEGYFLVSSGLGSSAPGHLLLVPTYADGRNNAVVELGFFHPIEPHDIELLRRSAEPIGIALRSAKLRTELEDLLEETQRQAHELQTQQEELRVTNEELEQQSRALQTSQQRLQGQQTELEHVNAQLEQQTQALEKQRDGLVRARAEAQRASTYKSEFLANMSHELRTPLNSSLILAKLLIDNREGNLTPEQIKFAQTIQSAGNDLLNLINDILDLSRIEAGKLDVRPVEVSPRRQVDELAHTLRPLAQDRQLELEVSVASGTPQTIHTDPTRLQQILRNLLSNAIKFTESGGVSLHVHPLGHDRVAFEVRDTGIGIPAEQHELVFEAFRQANGNSTRQYGGTGLGLSISRDLARLLGGDIELDSAPGRGSTFTLVIPVRHGPTQANATPPSPAAAVRAQSRPPPTSPRPPPSTSRATTPTDASSAVAAVDDRSRVSPKSRSILVIEDDPEFATIVADLARELDFMVLVAHTAEEGLSLAAQHRPSAIVLDLLLPDRSGLTVLDALKRDSATRHIPVHIVSATDSIQPALEMGATGYAVKPIARAQLAAALERLEAKISQKLRRVLVVEDDDVHRDSICRLLDADDVQTVAVGTAHEALERLGSTTFDCMVLDLSLPDRSGLQLLEEMSREEQYAFPPVIVYTGRSMSRQEEQQLRRFSSSIIIKGARSPERLLDEVTLFLHQVETELPPDRQRMLRDVRHRDRVFEDRRVLVVEDDVRNVFALTSVLEPTGATVEIARNGREALEHLAANPGVDLVLMDVMMPEMDGLQATREIRRQPELAKLPIIALTAKAMADDRKSCLAAGANDYIAKPLDVDKLLSLARVWMPK
ncbi:response regulator [Paraliomyxa miuraensis]|uniref:response regulator n=1 Tax=Paraliomyxa miuraensis TaxID=376150 RepID=UPI002257EF74|nr:response regulator [Paraliomyxa miuraensis]MCX4241916.1 response regulator [Paraliomyxa miuraensis]